MPVPLGSPGNDRDWRRFVAFSFAASDVLIEVDGIGVVTFVTGATEELVGLRADAIPGKRLLDLVSRQDRQALAEALGTVKPGHRMNPLPVGFVLAGALVHMSGFKLPQDPGHAYLTAARVMIPSARHAGVARDERTGLLCCEDFTRLVEDQIRLIQDSGQEAALTLMRLEGLDQLRQRIGDAELANLMHELGRVLQAYSLGGDSAGQLDDDKYGVVFTPGTGVAELMGRLRGLLSDVDPTGQAGLVEETVALHGPVLGHQDAAQAIRYAVNRFIDADAREFDIRSLEDGIQQRLQETVGRIGALRRIIAEDAFTLAFQPIVELQTRAVHHYEALTRFEGGASPFEMITFAEQVGIIEDFDLAVVRRVLATLRAHADRPEPLSIAVNLSARSLEGDLFVAALRALLATEPALRRRLLFEITGSYKAKDLRQTDAVIQALRTDGHLVCLDDFGAGGASFDYLQALHLDFVKLDGAYVRKMLQNRRDAQIMRGMAALCHSLKIDTIGEFVETEDQATRLCRLGVRLAQGWLFAKPGPIPQSGNAEDGAPAPAVRSVQWADDQTRWD
ncbi:MAG: EAL domain-containing protein [Alphaproteobacteria bacterium]